MSKRVSFSAAVLLVVLLAAGLRLYAAQRLNVDYDEPVYLSAAVEYARAMRQGDLKMLAWSEHTYEHPALHKILYGVVLLTQTPLDRLPEDDLPRLAPIASTEAGRWNIAARHLSVFLGTLAALALALVNPLAGLFLAVGTLSVKYTSEVYLEALPLLTGLLCALAYLRWFASLRGEPGSRRGALTWLGLSAVFLGMTAASKYVHAVAGIAVLFHFLLAVLRKQVPRRVLPYIAGWGLLSLVMFVVFDPYLWPHPIARLSSSLLFHQDFQDSRLVEMYAYPFWQPLRWLSAFPAYYNLGPASAFLVDIDTFLFVSAIIGLPRLHKQQPFFFYWLLIGLTFLLIWATKWPQYTLIVLAPFSMAAAHGVLTVWDLARAALVARSNRRASMP
ncbi:MAG: hypothetical protein V1755_06400 [Chloroflexota bacterium]